MKSKQRVKVQHGILTLMFMLGLMLGMSATVWADASVPYLAWDADRQKVVEVEGGCASYTKVTSSTTILENGWYVVSDGEVTINDRICVNGTAHLILCDGAKLTARYGITVNNNNALNIYGQSKGTGMLVATGFTSKTLGTEHRGYYPGIGADDIRFAAGDIIIHGGTVTAKGFIHSPGIGGLCEDWEEVPQGGKLHGTSGGNVMIYHGTVAASIELVKENVNAIGKGPGGNSDGDLTLGTGVKLYGNPSKMPEGVGDTDLIATGNGGVYSGTRSRYMKTVPPHTHTTGSAEIPFQPWTDANRLPDTAGSYYLTQDVTLSSSWNVPDGTTNLCLNGYGIIGSNKNVILNTATLNLYDCNSTQQTHYFTVDSSGLATVDDSLQAGAESFTGGYITGRTVSVDHVPDKGGGVHVLASGTFSMFGGTIIGNAAAFGGGVYIGRDAEFNLIDGSIAYNTVSRSGGGVDIGPYSKGFNMSGGSITNNTAGKDGGGINLRMGSKFNMTGGSITDNTANGNENCDGGGIWVSDQAGCNISGASKITGNKTAGKERNVYLAYNTGTSATSKINVDRALTSDAVIGVTLGTADGTGVFTEGLSGKLPTGKTPADIFTSDDTGYSVTATTDGEAQLIKKQVTPTQYQLVFDPGEGSGSMDPQKVFDGDTFTFPECGFAAPEKKTFDHWKMSGVDGIFYPDSEVEITSNCAVNGVITVTANWKAGTSPSSLTATVNGSSTEKVYSGEKQTYEGVITAASSDKAFDAAKFSYTGNKKATGTDVGVYTTELNGKDCAYSDTNYSVSWTVGEPVKLTITRADITPSVSIEGWTYGSTSNTPTVEGNPGGGDVTFQYKKTGDPDSSYTGTVPTDAGTYTVKAEVSETRNYNGGEATLDFTISPADMQVTSAGYNGVYDGKAHSITVNAPEGAEVMYAGPGGSFTEENPAFTDAGTYAVDFKVRLENYKEYTGTETVEIAKAAITIEADDKSSQYGASLAPLTYKVGGGYVEGDDLGVALSTDAKKDKAGTYAIRVSWNENPNYTATLTDGAYTVGKKPEPKPQPKINKAAAKMALDAGLKAYSSEDKVTASWGAVKGAGSYEVYASYCDRKEYSKVKTVSGKITSIDITKLAGKKLNTKKNLKFYVVAYKTVKGKKVKLAKSILVHAPGSKNSKRTNVMGVKVKKGKYTLKKGKTAKIRAKLVLEKKKRKPLKHESKFRYASSNKKVAKVSKKGKITAVGKGKCTIYVYSVSGNAKKIKVTVK